MNSNFKFQKSSIVETVLSWKERELNLKDTQGRTALHRIVMSRADTWGKTAQHQAIVARIGSIARQLIDAGINASIKDNDGMTALERAKALNLDSGLVNNLSNWIEERARKESAKI